MESNPRQFVNESGWRLSHAEQVEACSGDGTHAVREANQRRVPALRPDLEIPRLQALQGGQGEDEIPDSAGPDCHSSHFRLQYARTD